MRMLQTAFLVLTTLGTGMASAQDYLRDRAEVETMLSGATLTGVYLRSQSHYVLNFSPDGTLVDAGGAEARWWVNDSGQYCREWSSGRLAGNHACMDLVREGDGIGIYSDGNRVAEGRLAR